MTPTASLARSLRDALRAGPRADSPARAAYVRRTAMRVLARVGRVKGRAR